MDKIDGIDLSQEAAAVESAILEEKRREIQSKIKYVIGNIWTSKGSIKDLEDKLAKAKASLAKHQATYEAIQSGNWDVIKDELKRQETNG